jgi:hypothetical protein
MRKAQTRQVSGEMYGRRRTSEDGGVAVGRLVRITSKVANETGGGAVGGIGIGDIKGRAGDCSNGDPSWKGKLVIGERIGESTGDFP